MEKNKTVKVKFLYFQVVNIANDGISEERYDLTAWIKNVTDIGLENRKKEIFGFYGRLESLALKQERFVALNFIRMDEFSNTYKVKESQPAEHVDLDDDEYIGKNTVLLYDVITQVLMIQVNRGGFSVESVAKYINATNKAGEPIAHLRPILREFDATKCLTNNITKLDIRFANIKQCAITNSKDLKNILDTANRYDAVTAHIEIGLGHKDVKSLNKETIYETVTDIIHNKHSISSARVKVLEGNESVVYDLLENIHHDFISYNIRERGELAFSYVSDKMVEVFTKTVRRLYE